MPRLRRNATVLVALLTVGALSACGKHQDKNASVKHAETEGIYLDIGKLKYQVELSRQMNPYDTQDKALLIGIPAAQRQLAPDEVWFGVFLRVQNETNQPQLPADDIEIVDTQDAVFRPLTLDPTNVFAYRSDQAIAADQVLPLPDTPAYDTPARGAMLLFKLKNGNLANRPLELHIIGRQLPLQTGIVDLDV